MKRPTDPKRWFARAWDVEGQRMVEGTVEFLGSEQIRVTFPVAKVYDPVVGWKVCREDWEYFPKERL